MAVEYTYFEVHMEYLPRNWILNNSYLDPTYY